MSSLHPVSLSTYRMIFPRCSSCTNASARADWHWFRFRTDDRDTDNLRSLRCALRSQRGGRTFGFRSTDTMKDQLGLLRGGLDSTIRQ